MYNIGHVHSPHLTIRLVVSCFGPRGRVPSKLALGWVVIPDGGHGCPCLFAGFKALGVQPGEGPSPVARALPAKG